MYQETLYPLGRKLSYTGVAKRRRKDVTRMRGFAILLGFNLLGLAVHQWGHVPLPANLIGLMLFTASLFAGAVKMEWVEQTAQFLTKHMLLFFIPFLVGTMTFFPQIGAQWFSVLAGLVVSTFAVLAVTGWVTSALSGRSERKEREGREGEGHEEREMQERREGNAVPDKRKRNEERVSSERRGYHA